MLRPTVINFRNFSKSLGVRGFTLLEISVALGIGSVAVYAMTQLMTTSMKTITATNQATSFTGLSTFLSSSLLTNKGCGITIGIIDPKTKVNPSTIEINPAAAPEPAPITFAPSPPIATSSVPTKPIALLSYSQPIELRNSLGTPVITAGGQFGSLAIQKANFLMQPSTLNPLPDGTWAMPGQISITAVSEKVTKVFTKNLSLKITFIQNQGDTTATAKIVGCSSTEYISAGAQFSEANVSTVSSSLVANIPDGAGGLKPKQVSCLPTQYISGYKSDTGDVVCTPIPSCSNQPGKSLVWRTSGAISVPECKILICPPGKLPTSADPDGSGFIGSCADDSNFFIQCAINQAWTCNVSKQQEEQTYVCKAQSGQICTEDCSKRVDTVPGCPLNGATFVGFGANPRMTSDCTSVNGFSGYEKVGSNYYCKGSRSSCPSGWSTKQSHWAAKTCGGGGSNHPDYYNGQECYCTSGCGTSHNGSCPGTLNDSGTNCDDVCNRGHYNGGAGYHQQVTAPASTGVSQPSSVTYNTDCYCQNIWQCNGGCTNHWQEYSHSDTAQCTPDQVDTVWCY